MRFCVAALVLCALITGSPFIIAAPIQNAPLPDSFRLAEIIKASRTANFKENYCRLCDSVLSADFSRATASSHPDFINEAAESAIACHKSINDTAGISRWLKKFHEVAVSSKNESLMAWWMLRSAVVKIESNKYDSVIPLLLNAQEIFQKEGSPLGLTLTCEHLGGVYYAINDNQRAIYYHLKSLGYAAGNKFIEPIMLGNISLFYYRTGVYDSAKYYMQRTMEAELKIPRISGVNYITLLRIEYKLGAPDDSLQKYFALAVKANKQQNNYPGLMYGYIEYGKILLEKKQYKEAENILKQGIPFLDSCHGSDYLDYRQRLYFPLYVIYDSLHDVAKTLKYLKLYNTAAKEFDAEGNKRSIELADTRYNADKHEQQLEYEHQQEREKQRLRQYLLSGGIAFFIVIALLIYRNLLNQKKSAKAIAKQKREVEAQHRLSESLLLNILPEEVAKELKQKGSAKARLFEEVTVLFTDFKDFTIVSERLGAEELVHELNECFKAFDEIITRNGIEKIKTVGDAYLAVAGLPLPRASHAQLAAKAAIEIRDFMVLRRKELGEKTFEVRIGLHSGKVVAGIVGVKKYAYDIWGDTVNTAARMEQNSEAGKINISQTTYELIKDKFNCAYRGEIEAKNKGKMKMFFVEHQSSL